MHPETPPPDHCPDTMNSHLQSLWQRIHNEIIADQQGIERSLALIKAQKAVIKFLKDRIVCSHKALAAIGDIKEK